MRRLVEESDIILARDVGKALPGKVPEGIVDIQINGVGLQQISLTSTLGRYGGYLRWFTCPGCQKRVGKLYLPPGEQIFLCRLCHRLGYRAQLIRESIKTDYFAQNQRTDTRLKLLKKVAVYLESSQKKRDANRKSGSSQPLQ